MLVKILIGIAVVLGALAGFVALQPAEFSVSRTASIAAPPGAVYAQVSELRKWKAWSPWAKKDPNAKESYDGPAAGMGASMSWAGNSEVGEGRMTIIESRPNELLRFRLEFFKPLAGTSIAQFVFKEQGGGTEVVWSMSGHNNFIGKAMCLVFDMDKMVGGDFEQGFAGIKAIVEKKS